MTMTQKNNIITHVDRFLQQKSDHDWLMIPLNGKQGRDEFKNTIVYSTFPANLNQTDFESYIKMTFCDLPHEHQTKMAGLRLTKSQSFQQEDVVFDYAPTTGCISATLLQIVSQRNEQNELEILVGAISLVRKPTIGLHFNNDYWQSDKSRVQRGLQYLFAIEAKKELAYH